AIVGDRREKSCPEQRDHREGDDQDRVVQRQCGKRQSAEEKGGAGVVYGCHLGNSQLSDRGSAARGSAAGSDIARDGGRASPASSGSAFTAGDAAARRPVGLSVVQMVVT